MVDALQASKHRPRAAWAVCTGAAPEAVGRLRERMAAGLPGDCLLLQATDGPSTSAPADHAGLLLQGPRSWGCWLGGARLLCLHWNDFSCGREDEVDRGWARRQLATLRFGPQHGVCMLHGLPAELVGQVSSAWEWVAKVISLGIKTSEHEAVESGGGDGEATSTGAAGAQAPAVAGRLLRLMRQLWVSNCRVLLVQAR